MASAEKCKAAVEKHVRGDYLRTTLPELPARGTYDRISTG
jgi:hypothetical protein